MCQPSILLDVKLGTDVDMVGRAHLDPLGRGFHEALSSHILKIYLIPVIVIKYLPDYFFVCYKNGWQLHGRTNKLKLYFCSLLTRQNYKAKIVVARDAMLLKHPVHLAHPKINRTWRLETDS